MLCSVHGTSEDSRRFISHYCA